MNKFLGVEPLINPRTDEEIEAIGLSVPKEDRKSLKAKEIKVYEKLKEKRDEVSFLKTN